MPKVTTSHRPGHGTAQDLKICTKCVRAKPLSEFSKRPDRDSYLSMCKSCRAAGAAIIRQAVTQTLIVEDPKQLQYFASGMAAATGATANNLNSTVIAASRAARPRGDWRENPKLNQSQNDYCVSYFKLLFDCTDQEGRRWLLDDWKVTHDTFKRRARLADTRLRADGHDRRPMDCWSDWPADIEAALGPVKPAQEIAA